MLHILTTCHFERVWTFFGIKLNLFKKFKFKGNYVDLFFSCQVNKDFSEKKISLKVTARNQATNVEHQNTGLSMIAFYEYAQSKCTA